MGVGSGGQEGHGPPWIFIHGIFRSFCAIFRSFFAIFGLFYHWSPLWKRLNSAIFWNFLLFSVFFSVGEPPGIWLQCLLFLIGIAGTTGMNMTHMSVEVKGVLNPNFRPFSFELKKN